MQFGKLLEQWDLDGLKIKAGFLEMEWVPRDEDKTAAWEMYVELITRVTTQSLVPGQGTEKAALASVHSLFPLTRDIIKRNGRHSINFARIAVVVLNQMVRPFTTKWHAPMERPQGLSGDERIAFRTELLKLQANLRKYTRLLANMARRRGSDGSGGVMGTPLQYDKAAHRESMRLRLRLRLRFDAMPPMGNKLAQELGDQLMVESGA
jgi:hypothetical protein